MEPAATTTTTLLVEISSCSGSTPSLRHLLLTPTHLHIFKPGVTLGYHTHHHNSSSSSSAAVVVGGGGDDGDSVRVVRGSVSSEEEPNSSTNNSSRSRSRVGSFESGPFNYNNNNNEDTSVVCSGGGPSVQQNKRLVELRRVGGALGISVRGGAEHSLPLIISKLQSNSPAALSRNIYIGDAITAINGMKITHLSHDSAVRVLASSGPTVTLKLKFYSNAQPYLPQPQQQQQATVPPQPPGTTPPPLMLDEYAAPPQLDPQLDWSTCERSIPLAFAHLTRYMGSTDRLRVNGFEVRDGMCRSSSGVIHVRNSRELTSWLKLINSNILNSNLARIKKYQTSSATPTTTTTTTSSEVYYVGWVAQGTSSLTSTTTTTCENDENHPSQPQQRQQQQHSLLEWTSKFLSIKGHFLHLNQQPPGALVGDEDEVVDYWDDETRTTPTTTTTTTSIPLIGTLLRVVGAGEVVDGRQHVFHLQLSHENSSYPDPYPNYQQTATKSSKLLVQQPVSLYLSTETREELLRVETAWAKALKNVVKATKRVVFVVWWSGRPCQLELSYTTSSFNMYRSTSATSTGSTSSGVGVPESLLWSRKFSQLLGSSDDGRTKLRLRFSHDLPDETMECKDLHRVLFAIHSFLFAKIVVVD